MILGNVAPSPDSRPDGAGDDEIRIGEPALGRAQHVIERESAELLDAEPCELCDLVLGVATVGSDSPAQLSRSGI